MHVLVTGATGFLGSIVVRLLLSDGHRVTVVRRPTSDTRRISDVVDKVRFVTLRGGLDRDLELPNSGPYDAAIHMAAAYGRSGVSAQDLIYSNIALGVTVLEHAIASGARVFLNAGTVLPASVNRYALSKSHFVDWARLYARGSQASIVNARLHVMYGPGDHPSNLPAFLIDMCLSGAPRIPLTRGEQRRDFIAVHDAARALLVLMERFSGAVEENLVDVEIGTGASVSVREFAELIKRLTNSDSVLDFGALPYRDGEVMNLASDTSRLAAMGWDPEVPLVDGLLETIAWHQARRVVEGAMP